MPYCLHLQIRNLRLRKVGSLPQESHTASKRQNLEASPSLWNSQVVLFIPLTEGLALTAESILRRQKEWLQYRLEDWKTSAFASWFYVGLALRAVRWRRPTEPTPESASVQEHSRALLQTLPAMLAFFIGLWWPQAHSSPGALHMLFLVSGALFPLQQHGLLLLCLKCFAQLSLSQWHLPWLFQIATTHPQTCIPFPCFIFLQSIYFPNYHIILPIDLFIVCIFSLKCKHLKDRDFYAQYSWCIEQSGML